MDLSLLFQLAYSASETRAYFDSVDLGSILYENPVTELVELQKEFDQKVKASKVYYSANLVEINRLYSSLGLAPLSLPAIPSDYKDWLMSFMENLLSTIDVKDEGHKIINFGFCLGGIAGTIEALVWPLKFQLEAPEQAGQEEEIERLATLLEYDYKKMESLTYFIKASGGSPQIWLEWKNLEETVLKLISFNLPHKEIKFRKAIKISTEFAKEVRDAARKLIKVLKK